MKIVIATSIYLPEIGGPAIYAQKLKEGLEGEGNTVKIISYRSLKKYPQPFKIFLYFLRLFRNTKGYGLIYAFNSASCGLPACLVSRILRKKFLIRIGGDYLWERAVEAGRTKKPMREYYQESKSLKEEFWTRLIKKILKGADKVIFTSLFQRNIYLKYFNIPEGKTVIVQNPFPETELTNHQALPASYQLLYAGRLIKLKNLDFLIDIFCEVLQKTNKDLTLKIIGEGSEKDNLRKKAKELQLENKIIFEKPLSRQILLKEIQKSYLCVLPSLTEITPNFALECIKLRKPILLTKETEYYRIFKDSLVFIDPQNEKDLEEKILYLLDERNYQNYIERLKKIPPDWNWENVVNEHLKIFKYL